MHTTEEFIKYGALFWQAGRGRYTLNDRVLFVFKLLLDHLSDIVEGEYSSESAVGYCDRLKAVWINRGKVTKLGVAKEDVADFDISYEGRFVSRPAKLAGTEQFKK